MTRQTLLSAVSRLAVLGIALSFLAPISADAQVPPPGASSLSVSPPTVELDANPRQLIEKEITVDNFGDTARNISVVIQNFGAAGESGQAELTDESGPYSLAEWIKVSPASAVIAPKDKQKFKVTITVPDNPPPGGHFGALTFEPRSDPSDANVKVVSRVTSLFLLKVPGATTEKATLESFTSSKPGAEADASGLPSETKMFQKGPVDFHVRVKNEGNVQVKPDIKIEIYNLFGSKIATLTPESRVILPDSIRRADVRWDNKQLLGFYKARVTVTYGSGSQPQVLKAETTIWGMPIVTLGIGFGVLLAVFLLIWLPRKRLKKAFKALAASDD